jgi:perosamine synthetase
MLACGDPDIAERARSERNQGRGADMDWLTHERFGFNYRLSELQAAVGVAQLERADDILARRAELARRYSERLAEIDGLELPAEGRGRERRSWFVYPVQVPDGVDRDGVVAALAGRGVAAKAYLPCIHLQPYYRERYGFRGGEFPVAERAAARSLALPFFNAMEEEDVERVCDALREVLGP